MPPKPATKFKFPKNPGPCGDLLYKLRAERYALQKQVDALAAKEIALREHIIQTLPKSQAGGAIGKIAKIEIETSEVPVITDEKKFRAYINKTKNYHLAYKLRPSLSGIAEMWENGKQIPGIGKHKTVHVSCTKR